MFGADRCMFESNFPIDRSVTSYVSLWNAFKRIVGGCSAGERDALFHDTADRTYLSR
jgi:L-fuconolactonase